MNEYANNVNIESLQGSLETVTSMDSCLKSVDLSNYFVEIDNYLKRVNFEHGNCLIGYKNDMSLIYEKLEEIQKNMDSLKNALSTTIEGFSKTEQTELREDPSVPQLINATTDITQIPPVTTPAPNPSTTQTEDTTINTVPIGLGIAAAGITASVGAVVLDSMKTKKKPHIESYHEEEYEQPVQESTPQKIEPVFDDSPYHASRNQTAMNKFYGSNITEYYEKEDEESSDS